MSKRRKTIADSLMSESESDTTTPNSDANSESKEAGPEVNRDPKKAASEKKPKYPKPAFQEGKKAMTLYFKPEVSKQMKLIALEEDRTLHDVMREAINDFFSKKRKPPIA